MRTKKFFTFLVITIFLFVHLTACGGMSSGDTVSNGLDQDIVSVESVDVEENAASVDSAVAAEDISNLTGENLEEKYQAFFTFAENADEGVPFLLDAYEDADLHTKYLILKVLGRVDEESLSAEEVIPVIITSINSDDLMLLDLSFGVLARFSYDELEPYTGQISPAITPYINNQFEDIQVSATRLSGKIGTDEMIPYLIDVINLPMGNQYADSNSLLRSFAVVAISNLQNFEQVYTALVENLETANELSTTNVLTHQKYAFQLDATKSALNNLVLNHEELSTQALEMANDTSLEDFKRSAALGILGTVETQENNDYLLSVIEDTNYSGSLRIDAILSVGEKFVSDNEETLLDIANNEAGQLQTSAMATLAVNKKESLIPLLSDLYKNGSQNDRRIAVMLSKYFPFENSDIKYILLDGMGDRAGDFNLIGYAASLDLSNRISDNADIIDEILAKTENDASGNTIEGALEAIYFADEEIIRETGKQTDIIQASMELIDHPGGCYYSSFLLGRFGPEAENAQEIADILGNKLTSQGGLCLSGIIEASSLFGDYSISYIPVLIEYASGQKEAGYYDSQKDAITGLGVMGPAANEAIPTLVELTSSEEHGIPSAAITALGEIGEAAVPELINLLQNEDHLLTVLQAFQAIGPAALSAVPQIESLLTDTTLDTDMRAEVIFALYAIDPASYQSNINELLNDTKYSIELKEYAISLIKETNEIELPIIEIKEENSEN